jgi:hypothetical protein
LLLIAGLSVTDEREEVVEAASPKRGSELSAVDEGEEPGVLWHE